MEVKCILNHGIRYSQVAKALNPNKLPQTQQEFTDFMLRLKGKRMLINLITNRKRKRKYKNRKLK